MNFKISLRKIFSAIIPRKAGNTVVKETRINKNLLKQEPDKFIAQADKYDPEARALRFIESDEGKKFSEQNMAEMREQLAQIKKEQGS